jgi:hypothetical protein
MAQCGDSARKVGSCRPAKGKAVESANFTYLDNDRETSGGQAAVEMAVMSNKSKDKWNF